MQRRDYLKLIPAGAIGTAGLSGCLGGDGDDVTTLELWHDKGQNPNWNPAFDEAIPVANENIADGYEISATPYQSTDSFQGALRPVLGEEDGPALFSWWTGARLRGIVDDDYAYDITHLWQDHIDAGEYTESQMESFSVDGDAYAAPALTAYWPVWYNTETFDDLGVSPPDTWEEFDQLCQTIIDESGGDTNPIAIPLGPSWTGFVWFEDLLVRESVETYNQLCRGEISYTDSTVMDTLSRLQQLADDGYFGNVNNAFSLQLDDLPQVLEQGEYAMTLMGSWVSSLWTGDLSFDSYDWFELPAPNPDTGSQLIVEPTPFCAHSGFPDEDGLDAGIDALLGVEFQQSWCEFQGFIPANQEVDTSYLSDAKVSLADAIASGDYSFPLRYWENADPEVAVPASSTLQRAYRPNEDLNSVANDLESLRQEVHG